MEDFNLLVSSARGNEREANSELWYLIGELGDRSIKTDFTSVSGLTIAKTQLDPLTVIGELKSALRKRPWEFRYILKLKPVRKVVPCEVGQIVGAATEQAVEIGESETFRITLEKRRNEIGTRELIDAVAAQIPRKVNLGDPKKIVLIEVIGHVAGVSVIEPCHILSVEREKRAISLSERGGQISRPPAA